MKLLAALKFVAELLVQLATLSEAGLGRLVQRMNYIRELMDRPILPPFGEFKTFLGNVAHIINCSAKPFVPEGWKVVKHSRDGKLEWDPEEIQLCLSSKQQDSSGGWITGNDLHEEFKGKPALNANVLDYLLEPENQHLIPEEWKDKFVFFWGTVYRDNTGLRCVRYLRWNSGRWNWGELPLGLRKGRIGMSFQRPCGIAHV